jgi:hypothetical protein
MRGFVTSWSFAGAVGYRLNKRPAGRERNYLSLNAAQQVVYCEGTLLVAYS